MFTNSHISTQLASYRQGDLLAGAERHRLAAQANGRLRGSRDQAPAGWGLVGAVRRIATRRTVMPA
jgi:hypothetical protein